MQSPSAHVGTAKAARHTMSFQRPPRPRRKDGVVRRVGFEIEFSGLTLEHATQSLIQCFDGKLGNETAAEKSVSVDGLGTFAVEIDWTLLKDIASDDSQQFANDQLLGQIGSLATALVPIEVVAPPIEIDNLHHLDLLVDTLRDAGAVGTGESLIAAYGVHINPELPSLQTDVIASYVRACCLLQWWLADAHELNMMRKITPYIDLYPRAYLQQVLERKHTTLDNLFDDYLEHNATRNRAIDLLPLFAEIDPDRVRTVVPDPRIKARPTIHYRLPDCRIEDPEWSLHKSWDLWCVVEKLAAQPDALNELAERFQRAHRVILDVNRKQWVEDINIWLQDHGLA